VAGGRSSRAEVVGGERSLRAKVVAGGRSPRMLEVAGDGPCTRARRREEEEVVGPQISPEEEGRWRGRPGGGGGTRR
jgi:hypothetical protein